MRLLVHLCQHALQILRPIQNHNLKEARHDAVIASLVLSGIRLGFIVAHQRWIDVITSDIDPWQVNGPAQFIAQKALTNKVWQQQHFENLHSLSNELEQLLTRTFSTSVAGTALFKTVLLDNAPVVFDQLCQQGVYVRLCDENNALRFGVPTAQGLSVFAGVLESITYLNPTN